MSKAQNRNQLMKKLGAKPLNTVWSWCAVNEEKRQVYLSMWTDFIHDHEGQKRYIIQEPHWGIGEAGEQSPARRDHDDKLRLVFEEGYEPFGYFIEAKDPAARPREIAATRTTFVMRLQLSRESDGSIFGSLVERVNLL